MRPSVETRLARLSSQLDQLRHLVHVIDQRSKATMGSVEDLTAIAATLASDEDLLKAFVEGQAALNATQAEQIQVLTDALANVEVPPEVAEAVVALTKTSQDFEALLPVVPAPE